MRPLLSLLTLPLLLVALATPAQAQQTGDQALTTELRELVAAPGPADEARATIQEFLADARVADAAADRGIDTQRLSDGVGTLGDDEALSLAERVEKMKGELVGGDTITISASAIIIVLLILILVAVD
jgi:hypothetical protein